MPARHAIELGKAVVAVLLQPESAAVRIERHAEAVAMAVRKHLLDVRAGLASDRRARREEGIVGWRRSVQVQPQDDAAQVRVVGRRAAKLIVRRGHVRRTVGVVDRSAPEILQVAAPPEIADEDVQLVVGTDAEDAAIVVSSRRLSGVLLDGAEADDVRALRETGSVPHETVDPVTEQRRLIQRCGVRSRRALRPVEEYLRSRWKIRMKRDAEQPAFGAVVHREIEHSGLLVGLEP